MKRFSLIILLFVMGAAHSEVIIKGGNNSYLYTDDLPTQSESLAKCKTFLAKIGVPDNPGVCHGSEGPGNFIEAGNLVLNGGTYFGLYYYGKCKSPQVFNVSTAECGYDQQKGVPPKSSCVGDPINIAVGNSFQTDLDYSARDSELGFSRYYNSLDGLWRHTYSTRLNIAVDAVSVIQDDGRELFYSFGASGVVPLAGQVEQLIRNGDNTWLFTDSQNDKFYFSEGGQLLRQVDAIGRTVSISRVDGGIVVQDQIGHQLKISEGANFQPTYFSIGETSGIYTYDENGHLVSVSIKLSGKQIKYRQYQYESPVSSKLLTSVLDERGVTISASNYDSQARAIYNQLANGTSTTSITYNSDGTVHVENPLSKGATYKFLTVANVQRIIEIIGEPSANCPLSNTKFSYDSAGRVLTRTDAKGYVTTYSYNDRGLEISRTEASGTPQARVTTTEWYPTRFLRSKVVEPTRTTVYTYDDQGRETGRQVSAR